MLVAAVCGGVVGANLFAGEPDQSEAGPEPSAPTTTTQPAPPASSPAAAPSTAASIAVPEPEPAWPGEPLGEILASGADHVFGWDDELDGDDLSDVEGTSQGLAAINGAVFFPWAGADPPTLDDCRSIEEQERFQLIPADQFETRSFTCLRTTAGRYGYLETDHVVDLDPPELHYYYVIWKKPGDR